jgi:hypothetical protein
VFWFFSPATGDGNAYATPRLPPAFTKSSAYGSPTLRLLLLLHTIAEQMRNVGAAERERWR